MNKSNTVKDPLKMVKIRNGFFWAEYRNLIAVNILAASLLVIGLGAAGYLFSYNPPNKYYPTTPDYRLIMSPPVNEEYLPEADVIQVATNAIRGIWSYDYINWESQITEATKWFTVKGWNEFVKEFQASGVIKSVLANGQIASIRIKEAPYIKEKKLYNGSFTWIVVFPSTAISYTGREKIEFNYIVEMEMVRMPLDLSQRGVSVNALRVVENSASRGIKDEQK